MSRNKSQSSGKKATATRHTVVDLQGLDGLKGDNLAIFCCSDVRPLHGVAALIDWRLCGRLSQTLQSQMFSGGPGEVLLVPVSGRFGPRRLFVFGLGPASTCLPDTILSTCHTAVEVMRRAGAAQVVFSAPARRDDSGLERTFIKLVMSELSQDVEQVLTERV